MKYMAIIMCIVGAALGPGYTLYCLNYSGEHVQTFDVYDKKSINLKHKQGHSSIGIHTDFKENHSLTLDSSMNPIAIIGKGTYFETPSRHGMKTRLNQFRSAKFIASLSFDGETLLSEKFGFRKKIEKENKPSDLKSSDKNNSFGQSFTLNVVEPGTYVLNVKKSDLREVVLTNLTIEVRRNIINPNSTIATIGFLMFFLGALVVFYILRKKPNT